MRVRLTQGTYRNTKAYVLDLNEHTLYFSYKTCIGYNGPLGRFRRNNDWGPTTGRHINEMGLRNWPVVSKEEMEKTLGKI